MLQPTSPIIVRVVEEPVRGFGLGDVLIRAIGLTGVLALGGLVFGLALAALFIAYQKLKARWSPPPAAPLNQQFGPTPLDKA